MTDTKIESWRDLLVWQKAHALTLALYRLTKTFPQTKGFASLTSFVGPLLPFQPTLLKAKAAAQPPSFVSF
jgi:23S rRNA-intervening sequence protein